MDYPSVPKTAYVGIPVSTFVSKLEIPRASHESAISARGHDASSLWMPDLRREGQWVRKQGHSRQEEDVDGLPGRFHSIGYTFRPHQLETGPFLSKHLEHLDETYNVTEQSEDGNHRDLARPPTHPSSGAAIPQAYHSMLAGAAAGLVSSVVTCPLDVIKTRLQAQVSRKGAPDYEGVRETMNRIWRSAGIRGLYRGLGPTVLGYLPTWGIYFSVYDQIKNTLTPAGEPRIGYLSVLRVA
jgi:hypothetical protein